MIESHETHENRETPRPEPMAQDAAARADRPMLDREVPLPGSAGDSMSMAALHQWLDGERSAADATLDPTQVALWSRLSAETDRRRQVTVPDGFLDRVMSALPSVESTIEAQPVTATSPQIAPTAGVPLSLALLIGTALLAAGILIGRVIA